MKELYESMFWIAVGVTTVFNGGFVLGYFVADRSRKMDDVFNPKLRSDSYYGNRDV